MLLGNFERVLLHDSGSILRMKSKEKDRSRTMLMIHRKTNDGLGNGGSSLNDIKLLHIKYIWKVELSGFTYGVYMEYEKRYEPVIFKFLSEPIEVWCFHLF